MIILLNKGPEFKDLMSRPKSRVYEYSFDTKIVTPIIIKDCLREGPGILRLIVYRPHILSTEKILETIETSPESEATLPLKHYIVPDRGHIIFYSEKRGEKGNEIQDVLVMGSSEEALREFLRTRNIL